jgi:hypothetical protein
MPNRFIAHNCDFIPDILAASCRTNAPAFILCEMTPPRAFPVSQAASRNPCAADRDDSTKNRAALPQSVGRVVSIASSVEDLRLPRR